MSEKKPEIILRDERGNNIIEVNPDNIAANMVNIATKTDIMTPEDKQFFIANTDRWQAVQENCHIWRTNIEKKSILSELPTTHLRFHQAILENKVFVDETVRLAKEAEIQKLDAEELYVDIEKLKSDIEELETQINEENSKEIEHKIKKKSIKLRKKTVELQEKAYQIQQSAVAMKYRVDELKDWKTFEDNMIQEMIAAGYSEEQIWNKNFGQLEGYFFHFLTKYQGVFGSKDGGEIHNLTYLARFSVEEAVKNGVFREYLGRCNQIQLNSLQHLGYIQVETEKDENGIERIKKINILV